MTPTARPVGVGRVALSIVAVDDIVRARVFDPTLRAARVAPFGKRYERAALAQALQQHRLLVAMAPPAVVTDVAAAPASGDTRWCLSALSLVLDSAHVPSEAALYLVNATAHALAFTVRLGHASAGMRASVPRRWAALTAGSMRDAMRGGARSRPCWLAPRAR